MTDELLKKALSIHGDIEEISETVNRADKDLKKIEGVENVGVEIVFSRSMGGDFNHQNTIAINDKEIIVALLQFVRAQYSTLLEIKKSQFADLK